MTAPITAREALTAVSSLSHRIPGSEDYRVPKHAIELVDEALAALSVHPAREGLLWEALNKVIDAISSHDPLDFPPDVNIAAGEAFNVLAALSAAPAPGERAAVWFIERQDLEPGRTHYYCEPAPRRHDWTLDVHAARKFATKAEALAEAKGVSGLHVREHIFGLVSAAPAPVETGWQDIASAPKDRDILVWPSIYKERPWDVARFDDDRYAARTPRPFWRRNAPTGNAESRNSPPLMWLDPPAPSTGEG